MLKNDLDNFCWDCFVWVFNVIENKIMRERRFFDFRRWSLSFSFSFWFFGFLFLSFFSHHFPSSFSLIMVLKWREMIEDEVLFAHFRKFCVEQYCEENLMFWVESVAFRSQPSHPFARHLYEVYPLPLFFFVSLFFFIFEVFFF